MNRINRIIGMNIVVDDKTDSEWLKHHCAGGCQAPLPEKDGTILIGIQVTINGTTVNICDGCSGVGAPILRQLIRKNLR